MLVNARALNPNFNRRDMHALRCFYPRIATKLNWIHRVRKYRSANPEMILGDRVSDTIVGIVDKLPDNRVQLPSSFDRT